MLKTTFLSKLTKTSISKFKAYAYTFLIRFISVHCSFFITSFCSLPWNVWTWWLSLRYIPLWRIIRIGSVFIHMHISTIPFSTCPKFTESKAVHTVLWIYFFVEFYLVFFKTICICILLPTWTSSGGYLFFITFFIVAVTGFGFTFTFSDIGIFLQVTNGIS